MSHCITDQCHGKLNTNIIMSECVGHCRATLNSPMINAQTDFSMNLLRQNGINSSTILSPISITIALAMMYLGAKENTAAQIRNTIAKGISDDEIHSYFSSFLNYSSNYKSIQLESANRLYVGNDFEILESYIDGIKNYYNGEFEQIDFRQLFEAADKINKFVAKATHDKYQNFIDADSIDPFTVMISINAIYFKAQWNNQFWECDTFDKPFYSSPNDTKIVKMMSHRMDDIPYFRNDDVEIIGLPYKKHEATMYIILPREKFGLEKAMNKLDSTTLIDALTNTVPQTFIVKLPRFKIETSFSLVDSLKKLGINDAFDYKADFTGISRNAPFKVSEVIHKAFISTDENGTEAAAVTGGFVFTSRPPNFVVNHPFLFIIADKKLNFLFTGTFFG